MDKDRHLARGRSVLMTESEELRLLAERLNRDFTRAINLLGQSLAGSGKIIVLGVGKSENIATKLAATFNSTGAPSVVLDCQNALHGDIGVVTQGDVVVALSYSGETAELLNILPHLRRRAGHLVAVTGNPTSTLASAADVVLDIQVRTEACPLNLAPTSSTTNMLALGDALAMALLESRDFSAEDFAQLHPEGNLGRRLLTKVTDIMRTGDRLALARPDETVEEALHSMTHRKSGAVVVTDQAGRLAGIFTHGDFVRGYQSDRHMADQPVGRHMTADPVSIHGDKLAADAVKILEENRIDELVVIDDDQHVIGLVDVQDLTRARIF